MNSAKDLQLGEFDGGSILANALFLAFQLFGAVPLGQAGAECCDVDAGSYGTLSIYVYGEMKGWKTHTHGFILTTTNVTLLQSKL